jgi:hypothetical protein
MNFNFTEMASFYFYFENKIVSTSLKSTNNYTLFYFNSLKMTQTLIMAKMRSTNVIYDSK